MGFTVERRAHGTGDCCTKPRQEVRSRRNGMVVFMKPNSLDTTTLTTCVYRLFVTPPAPTVQFTKKKRPTHSPLYLRTLLFREGVVCIFASRSNTSSSPTTPRRSWTRPCPPLLPTTTASRAAMALTTPTRGSTATSSGSWRCVPGSAEHKTTCL